MRLFNNFSTPQRPLRRPVAMLARWKDAEFYAHFMNKHEIFAEINIKGFCCKLEDSMA